MEAIEAYQKSIRISRSIGNRRAEGNAVGNLGIIYFDLGDYRKAIECYEESSLNSMSRRSALVGKWMTGVPSGRI